MTNDCDAGLLCRISIWRRDEGPHSGQITSLNHQLQLESGKKVGPSSNISYVSPLNTDILTISTMTTKLERAQQMLQWLKTRGGHVHAAAELRDGGCRQQAADSMRQAASHVSCLSLVSINADAQTAPPAYPSLRRAPSPQTSASCHARSTWPSRPRCPRAPSRPSRVCLPTSWCGATASAGTRACSRRRTLACTGCGTSAKRSEDTRLGLS